MQQSKVQLIVGMVVMGTLILLGAVEAVFLVFFK